MPKDEEWYEWLDKLECTDLRNEVPDDFEVFNADIAPNALNTKYRNEAAMFLSMFSKRVNEGFAIPNSWMRVVAQMLGETALAAHEPDAKKRAADVMKAMRLNGRWSKELRDEMVGQCMASLIVVRGMSETEAKTHLSLDLEALGVTVPEETLLSIYRKNRESSDEDVRSMASSCKDDSIQVGYLYDFLAKSFR